MKNILVLSLLLLLPLGCATDNKKFDSAYLKENAQANFKHPRTKCYEAAKHAIEDMGGKVQKEKAKNFKFYTTRFNAGAYSLGKQKDGVISSKEIKRDHKIYISVKGNENECSVRFIKYKAWKGSKKIESLPDELMHQEVFTPFFNSVMSHLTEAL